MSIRAWGGFGLDYRATSEEKTRLAFEATKVAAENGMGIILGSNVSVDLQRGSEVTPNTLPFEIVDDPTTNVAEELLSGDGVKLRVEHKRVDKGESLDSRITRLQRFFRRVPEIETVKEVVLHVNSGFGEEVVLETTVSDLKDKLIEKYTWGRTWTPTVKVVLKR